MWTVRDLLTRLRSLRTDPEGSGLTLITIVLVGLAVAISYIVFAPQAPRERHPQADASRTGLASAAPLSPTAPLPSALPTALPTTRPSAQPSAQMPLGP